jgi:enamine deaminase RidA (YjgF/YER057c/UK114 family)
MTDQQTAEKRLAELGIRLPEPPSQVGSYRNALSVGDTVHLSGHGPVQDGRPAYRGRVPDEVSMPDAVAAARLTMLNLLSSLRAEIGSLDRVVQIIHVFGMIHTSPGFQEHPRVIDGASDLLGEIFGERGAHTRSAVGMHSLPYSIPVEIEMSVRVS